MIREKAIRKVCRELGDKPFKWGDMDCCQIARHIYIAIHGNDPATHLQYDSEESALEIISKHGGLAGLMTSILGHSVEVAETQIADILRLDLPHVGEIIGIRVGDGALVPVSTGLHKADLRHAIEGWRI
jgi:hypothetical protein